MLYYIETIPLHWHTDKSIIASAIEIANQTARSLYDCLYLSLAINMHGQMITADKKFYDALQYAFFAQSVKWIEDI